MAGVLLYFPEELQDLQRELLHHHQDLILRIADVYPPTVENQLAKLGADLDIILDGDYDLQDLCKVLMKRLVARRDGKMQNIINYFELRSSK